MTTKVFYCFDKTNKIAISYGPIPETWRNITGLSDIYEGNYIDLNYAGHNFGFLTLNQALDSDADIDQLMDIKNIYENNQWNKVKEERNNKLRNTDWTELPSVVENKSADWVDTWKNYRTQLRNITNQMDPFNVDWPNEPNV